MATSIEDIIFGGAVPDTLQIGFAPCALGTVVVARSEKGLCAVLPGDSTAALRRDLQRRFPAAILADGDGATQELANQVAAFIDAPAAGLTVPLDLQGSDFEQQVWRALQGIPAGQTVSYGEIARRIGSPGRAQDVAQACAANALAVVVPCHRVVKSDGSLSGYRWGAARKRRLLQREAENTPGHLFTGA